MAQFLVIGFQENLYRAADVLDELRVLDEEWILALRDAVAVHRDDKGRLKMDQSYQPTGHLAKGWGGVLGLVIGASLNHVSGPNYEAVSGAMDASFLRDIGGIPDDFFESVSKLPCAGDSAIYTILDSVDTDAALACFRALGGKVLYPKPGEVSYAH